MDDTVGFSISYYHRYQSIAIVLTQHYSNEVNKDEIYYTGYMQQFSRLAYLGSLWWVVILVLGIIPR